MLLESVASGSGTRIPSPITDIWRSGMLCSSCSEIIRPVVAADIDGTLGDYNGYFIDFAEQYVGRELYRTYTGSTSFRIWFWTANHIGTDEFRAIKLAYRQG